MKNIGLLFLAFFLACIFWLATVSSLQDIKSYENPITVKLFNTPTEMHAQTDVKSIFVKIDSVQTKNTVILPENFQAFIDLSEAKIGTQLLPVQVKSQDSNIRIVSYAPTHAEVSLEKKEESVFPLEIEQKGNISPQYEIKSISSPNNQVTIRAGNQTLKSIKKVVAVVTLNNESESFRTSVSAKALDKNNIAISNIEIEPENIRINVEIQASNDEKLVGIKLNTSGNLAIPNTFIESLSIEPNVVHVQGAADNLKTIDFLQTETVDLSKIEESGDLKITIIPPLNASISEENEVTLHVKLQNIVPSSNNN